MSSAVRSDARNKDPRDHYDVVIIGSGFGGSVMAYRLADADLKVCVLERGQAYPPGSFPRTPYRMKHNFWDPSEGYYGLFNVWSFRELDAVVSSGLGGGSLIYANVLLRKDERWFVKEDIYRGGYEYWPITRAHLDPHYDCVEKMLGAQPYPFQHRPYNETPKTVALKSAADELRMDWSLPKLGVTFGNAGEAPVPGEPIRRSRANLHGRTRLTCRLCGECYIGCNYGSKNTLDYNYLSEAQRLGAEIKTLCEVRSFEPYHSGKYAINYVEHDLEREGVKTATHDHVFLPPLTITADRVVLAAGTLGSTFLMLSNRGAFPHISKQLGTRFCGNGDLLAFAVNCSQRTSGGKVPRLIEADYGTVITSAIRVPDQVDGGQGRGFYVEDMGFPQFASWLMHMFDVSGAAKTWRSIVPRLLWQRLSKEPDTDLSAEIAGLFGTAELSSSLLPMIGVGRDIPDGRMALRDNKLDVDWRKQRSEAYFERIRDTTRYIAQALGATYADNPSWYLSRLLTMHPLGGCPMGRDEKEGVVNSYGEVFNYPGFYIADGSVMPGPVGTNPSLTIAALADRFADGIIESGQAQGRARATRACAR